MIVYHVARRHNYCKFTYFMMCADSLYDQLGRTKKARASTRVCRRKPFTATQSTRTNSAKTCGRMERDSWRVLTATPTSGLVSLLTGLCQHACVLSSDSRLTRAASANGERRLWRTEKDGQPAQTLVLTARRQTPPQARAHGKSRLEINCGRRLATEILTGTEEWARRGERERERERERLAGETERGQKERRSLGTAADVVCSLYFARRHLRQEKAWKKEERSATDSSRSDNTMRLISVKWQSRLRPSQHQHQRLHRGLSGFQCQFSLDFRQVKVLEQYLWITALAASHICV